MCNQNEGFVLVWAGKFSNWIQIGLCAEKPTHHKDGGGEEADGDAQHERGG